MFQTAASILTMHEDEIGGRLPMSAEKKLNIVALLTGALAILATFSIYMLQEMKSDMQAGIRNNRAAIADAKPRIMLLESLAAEQREVNKDINRKLDRLVSGKVPQRGQDD